VLLDLPTGTPRAAGPHFLVPSGAEIRDQSAPEFTIAAPRTGIIGAGIPS